MLQCHARLGGVRERLCSPQSLDDGLWLRSLWAALLCEFLLKGYSKEYREELTDYLEQAYCRHTSCACTIIALRLTFTFARPMAAVIRKSRGKSPFVAWRKLCVLAGGWVVYQKAFLTWLHQLVFLTLLSICVIAGRRFVGMEPQHLIIWRDRQRGTKVLRVSQWEAYSEITGTWYRYICISDFVSKALCKLYYWEM